MLYVILSLLTHQLPSPDDLCKQFGTILATEYVVVLFDSYLLTRREIKTKHIRNNVFIVLVFRLR